MDIKLLKMELKKMLSEKRYQHSVRVYETGIKIAKLLELEKDIEKIAIASILHDYAKELSKEILIKISKDQFLEEIKNCENNIKILHSYVGSYLVETKFGIKDEEILNAIKYHTTGRKNMSLIEKIVYIADAIEPNRKFKHIEKIRKLVYNKEINEALLFIVNESIVHLIGEEREINSNSIDMRNWILNEIKRET